MSVHKALTLEEIIESFVDVGNKVDSELVNIFLYTYRTYCSPIDVINLLDKRLKFLNSRKNEFDIKEKQAFVKAIIILLNMWLQFPFAYDFYEVPNYESLTALLSAIRRWPVEIDFMSATMKRDSVKNLETCINDILNTFTTLQTSENGQFREMAVDCTFMESFTINSKQREYEYKSFLQQHAEVIAVSLTYLDQFVLQKLKLHELIKHVRHLPAASVKAVIENYNQLHNVVKLTVMHPILANKSFDQNEYSGRNSPDTNPDILDIDLFELVDILALHPLCVDTVMNIIQKWIFVAQELHNIKNVSSLTAILTALNSPELRKFLRVFKSKKLKQYKLYQSLLKKVEPLINENKETNNLLMNSDDSNRRGKTKSIKGFITEIPYLGTYLRHLSYIDEVFPNYLQSSDKIYNGNEDQPINISKCRKQFDVLAKLWQCISSLKINEMSSDEAFMKWYHFVGLEFNKHKKNTSVLCMGRSSLSLNSLKSSASQNSYSSSENLSSLNQSQKYTSHECLAADSSRPRFISSPSSLMSSSKALNHSVGSNLCDQQNASKVATVKLKGPEKLIPIQNIYSSSHLPAHMVKAKRQHGTVGAACVHDRDRPSLSNIVRSSSSVEKMVVKDTSSWDNILYKKIQIYEKDRTSAFLERVFEKFQKPPSLSISDFEVVQIIDRSHEITIPSNANIFYALAERPEYNIEVRSKLPA